MKKPKNTIENPTETSQPEPAFYEKHKQKKKDC